MTRYRHFYLPGGTVLSAPVPESRVTFGTYVTPTRFIPFDRPRRPPDGPPPLVSASWLALMSSLAARHRADVARRQYFERLAAARPLGARAGESGA